MRKLRKQTGLCRSGLFAGSLLLLLTGIHAAVAQSDASQMTASTPSDTITFINGDTLKGELEEATTDGVTFKSPVAGELTVKWDKIKELKSDREFAVLAKNEKLKRKTASSVVPQGPISIADNNVEVRTPSGPKTVPVSETSHLVDKAAFDKQIDHSVGLLGGWAGAATADVSLVRATQNQTTFTGGINLVRAIPSVEWLPPRDRTLIDYNQAYGSTSQTIIAGQPTTTVKTNIFHADAERDQYLTPSVYAFGGVAFDHNFSQGLDLQQQYGGGIGWTAIRDAIQQLDLRGDIHYEKQQFFDATLNQNLIGSTFGETYRRKLPRTILLNEFANISPAWNNTNAYSAHAGASLTFPVYKGIGFNVGAIDDYLNNAPSGFKKNSFQFTTGLTYAFAQK
jgi:hypothetical protein